MSNPFWLPGGAGLQPLFLKSHGRPRVDDRRVLSGMTFINRNGLRWCDAPREYGPPHNPLQPLETLEADGHVRQGHMTGLAAEAVGKKTIMVDAIDLKAHHTVSSLRASSADRKTVRWPHVPTIGGPAGWLRTWVATPARRRGARRAMLALARRIAEVLHRMWREDADFRLDLPP